MPTTRPSPKPPAVGLLCHVHDRRKCTVAVPPSMNLPAGNGCVRGMVPSETLKPVYTTGGCIQRHILHAHGYAPLHQHAARWMVLRASGLFISLLQSTYIPCYSSRGDNRPVQPIPEQHIHAVQQLGPGLFQGSP